MKQDAAYIAEQITTFPLHQREAMRARFQQYVTAIMEDYVLAKKPEPWEDYRQAWSAFQRDGNLDHFREVSHREDQ